MSIYKYILVYVSCTTVLNIIVGYDFTSILVRANYAI